MAQLSVSAAARAVGKDRGTIHRYIKSGRLSASRNAAGATVIETAELLRVFGVLQGDGGKATVVKTVAAPAENNSVQQVLESTLELLKQQLKASHEREERLLVLLGQEQESRRDLERRLLPPGTDPAAHAEPQKTAATSKAASVSTPESAPSQVEGEEKKRFWSILFGK